MVEGLSGFYRFPVQIHPGYNCGVDTADPIFRGRVGNFDTLPGRYFPPWSDRTLPGGESGMVKVKVKAGKNVNLFERFHGA